MDQIRLFVPSGAFRVNKPITRLVPDMVQSAPFSLPLTVALVFCRFEIGARVGYLPIPTATVLELWASFCVRCLRAGLGILVSVTSFDSILVAASARRAICMSQDLIDRHVGKSEQRRCDSRLLSFLSTSIASDCLRHVS